MLMAKIRSIIAQQERQRDALLNDLGLSLYEYLNRKKGASKTSKPSRKPLTDSRADSEPGAPFGTKGIPSSAEILRKLESEYGISKREMEVISYLRQGLYYKEIAAELNVSAHTVETYRKRIFKKCGIQNKIDLLRIFNPD